MVRGKRGHPLGRVLVALGLIDIVGNSDELRASEIVGESLATSRRPSARSRGPSLAEGDNMVDVEVLRVSPGGAVIDRIPRPGGLEKAHEARCQRRKGQHWQPVATFAVARTAQVVGLTVL